MPTEEGKMSKKSFWKSQKGLFKKNSKKARKLFGKETKGAGNSIDSQMGGQLKGVKGNLKI